MIDFFIAWTALIAAGFWFLSATTILPKRITYWYQTPADDPYTVAVKRAAKFNTWAAGFTAYQRF